MSTNILEVDEEAFNKHIYKEFNKTKKDLQKDINIMREWAKTQTHFPEEPSKSLLRYLVLANKFCIEKAKQKLDMYYTFRSVMPEIQKCGPLSPEMILGSKVVYWIPLPKITHDFKRIFYLHVNPNFGPEFYDHERQFEHLCNFIELIICEDKCYSHHTIIDCSGFQLGHLTKFNLMVVKKALNILEKVFASRVASCYVVKCAKSLETFVNNVVKPLLSQKLKDRLHIHSDVAILFEVFGKAALPKDIGGEERSLDELNDCVLKKFEENKDRFAALRTLRVDETRRPQKLVNDDILGYYGNFKKISID